MYLSTDMWYKKVQVILGLIKRENLILSPLPSASESRKMGQFTILSYPASSFKDQVVMTYFVRIKSCERHPHTSGLHQSKYYYVIPDPFPAERFGKGSGYA